MSTASVGAPRELARGIDVSAENGPIPWSQVSAAGVVFAYAITSTGTSAPDPRFAENWDGMKRAGILRGACHFFRPARAPEAQVESFSSIVGAPGDHDLPPAMRLKAVKTATGLHEWDGVREDKRLEMILNWLRSVERLFRRRPVIFTNRRFLTTYVRDASALRDFDLWISDYQSSAEPGMPSGWTGWRFWRYAESGSLPGLLGRFSLDRFNGSQHDLLGYCEKQGESRRPSEAAKSEEFESEAGEEGAEEAPEEVTGGSQPESKPRAGKPRRSAPKPQTEPEPPRAEASGTEPPKADVSKPEPPKPT